MNEGKKVRRERDENKKEGRKKGISGIGKKREYVRRER
jgi:hypothetical protein